MADPILLPYNGLYNVITVDLNTANNGTEYRVFHDPDNTSSNLYIGYVRVIKADDVCTISLGAADYDQIPMIAGSWFEIQYHRGFNTVYVTNPASSSSTAQLILLVTVG